MSALDARRGLEQALRSLRKYDTTLAHLEAHKKVVEQWRANVDKQIYNLMYEQASQEHTEEEWNELISGIEEGVSTSLKRVAEGMSFA